MATSNYAKVKDLFDKKRAAAETAADERREKLRLECPEFAEVDRSLSECGIALLRYMQDIGCDHSKDILNLKKKTKELKALKTDILKSLGLPEDYTSPSYECKKCNDTGLVGIDVCECFKKALRMENYLSSGLGKALVRQRFENFDLSLYSDDAKSDMTEIFNYCKEYGENFSKESPSLLFIGGTGLGKTHLSSAIAMKALDKGASVIYDTAQNIFSAFEKNRFNKDDTETPKYLECDLLIIDDLGAELNSNMAESALYLILNARMNSLLPTIINTNLAPKDMRSKYDSRIISRLFGQFSILQFSGTDIRMKKLLGE